ncbi:MAG TPA: c-type cytochrome [Terriglobales bacterium]
MVAISPDQECKVCRVAPVAAGEPARALFDSNCSICHGPDARGAAGPDLVESQVVLDDVDGKQTGAVVATGFPESTPPMPAFQFKDAEARDLAAFLHSRVLAVANLAHGQYVLPFKVTGNAAAGDAFFNGAGRCLTCHSVTGDLAHIGSIYQPIEVQNAFLEGRAGRGGLSRGRGAGSAEPVTVTLANGQTITGTLDYQKEFRIALTDASGTLHSIAIPKGVQGSTPPSPLAAHQALLSKLTDADIHNLTAYLVTLK